MKTKAIFYLAGLFFLALFSGCSEDENAVDDQAPTVADVKLNGLDENIIIQPGTEMQFDARFQDNILLGQYKIDIHNNFKDHGHGRIVENQDFTFSAVYDLAGKSETVHEHIDVSSEATPGAYHFTLQFFDAVGNEGEIKALTFEIADPSGQPTITITSPDPSIPVQIAAGKNLSVEGLVEDPDGLKVVHVALLPEGEDHSHERDSENALFEKEILLHGATSWNFDYLGTIELSEGIALGHYELSITAEDMQGNTSRVTIEVHVE